MAIAPAAASSTDPNPVEETASSIDAPGLNYFVFGLFFIFGGITSLNDVIIPKLQELFTLSNFQASLVQVWFFIAYALIGLPGAALVRKIGYMRGAVAGLGLMIAGCLLFIPASNLAIFGFFLFAYFILASGVVVVQVVANPLISLLGPPESAHSRLNFAQAFNAFGTVIFPYVGSILILGGLAKVSASALSGAQLTAFRQAETQTIWHSYLGLAIAIGLVALAVWHFRDRLKGEKHEQSSMLSGFSLLKRPRFSYGSLCIFVYVGAEVSVGSFMVRYLEQSSVLGLTPQEAGKRLIFFWGGACLGRFIGSWVLTKVSPGKALAFNAIGAITLIAISTHTTGFVSGYTLLAVGLMNSIMFPTIFSLACEKLGPRAADGSGIINVAIAGGAVIPALYGKMADVTGSYAIALIIPAICYAIIAGFGIYARRPA